jgi:hypothetical protein
MYGSGGERDTSPVWGRVVRRLKIHFISSNKWVWASGRRASLALIRQLEFALTRLEVSVDQMLVALQFTVSHRVPAKLLSPLI